MTILQIEHLDVIFGGDAKIACKLMDQGQSKHDIQIKAGSVVAVQNANLSIEKGEIFVLMGLSGSGKSSLLRAINGLNPITRGDVTVHLPEKSGPLGKDFRYSIANSKPHVLRYMRSRHISMVFQRFALLPWRSVEKNVSFGLELCQVEHDERMERAKKCLELVGLKNWAKHTPQALSGGMQQRVGLARALATDADILLMDEPFSALDPLIRSHLQQELLHLQKRLGKTILFVTHDLDEALKIGNRIAIMQDGKIIQVDSPEYIVAHPKTPYVKEFVSHIDHTKLLRAKTVMNALHMLKRNDAEHTVFLDQRGEFRCLLDENDRPKRSISAHGSGRIVPWSIYQSGGFSENDLVCGGEHLMIKDIIAVISRTKRPMLVQDKDGKMVGVIRQEDILQALCQ